MLVALVLVFVDRSAVEATKREIGSCVDMDDLTDIKRALNESIDPKSELHDTIRNRPSSYPSKMRSGLVTLSSRT